ncbi:MAG: sulfite exporter TauE/SafE family protein [Clostridia bacterium]|nr:sulfite exporter TauE/SafE family protein [Clostridia bacterium]
MIKNFLSKKWVVFVLFSIASFLAGGINGFVGTGGGILLVFAFSKILNIENKDAFASSLSVTVPTSAVAIYNYVKQENIDFSLLKQLWLPVLLGGILGAFLVDKLKVEWLSSIFAVLVIYAGTCLILR